VTQHSRRSNEENTAIVSHTQAVAKIIPDTQRADAIIASACWVFEMVLAAAGVWETIAEENSRYKDKHSAGAQRSYRFKFSYRSASSGHLITLWTTTASRYNIILVIMPFVGSWSPSSHAVHS